MSSILYKNTNTPPLMAVSGEGVWIKTACGRRVLDTCGGVVVSSLGHCHPRIQDAMAREAYALNWAHAGSFTSPAAEELAEFLTGRSGGLTKCNFLSGGSEVMELALKVILQVHHERGEPQRRIFISRRQSYHGSTLGMLGVSGNPARRFPFEGALPEPEVVSSCNVYRGKRDGESDAAYVARLAAELDGRIRHLGPEHVAGFLAEPVVGSTAGAVPFVPGYLSEMQRVCRRHGIIFLLDDVMCGMGRTGYLFSHLEDGFTPDMVAIGKGLAAGYQPIAGLLISDAIFQSISKGSGVLRNGQTHVNHPYASAIALEVQKTVVDDDLLCAVQQRGAQLRQELSEALGHHANVGDIRGKGLMIGVELVADRTAKSTLPDPAGVAARLKAEALSRDMLIYPGSGTVDGKAGNHVMFAPPFISTAAEITMMVERFVEVVEAVMPSAQAGEKQRYAGQ